MKKKQLEHVIEGAIYAADKPMTVAQIQALFSRDEKPSKEEVQAAIEDLQDAYKKRGVELIEVASGFRFQVRAESATWISKLWEEKPARYSRALLETLVLVAYRQPITRGEIEEVRGVVVSSGIMKTLLERDWIRAVGHRDVPGKPSLYATTKYFLDYFNLKSLSELPTLAELQAIGEEEDKKRQLDIEAEALALEERAAAKQAELAEAAEQQEHEAEMAARQGDEVEQDDEIAEQSEQQAQQQQHNDDTVIAEQDADAEQAESEHIAELEQDAEQISESEHIADLDELVDEADDIVAEAKHLDEDMDELLHETEDLSEDVFEAEHLIEQAADQHQEAEVDYADTEQEKPRSLSDLTASLKQRLSEEEYEETAIVEEE